jgi:hypothetical protein
MGNQRHVAQRQLPFKRKKEMKKGQALASFTHKILLLSNDSLPRHP